MTEKQIADLEYRKKVKMSSIKNKLVLYWNFIIMPIFILAQLVLPLIGSAIEIPLEEVIYSTMGINSLYFGVNFLQGKFGKDPFNGNNGGK